MYFDVTPKNRIESLFGMNFLVNSLVSYINNRNVRMIAIRGLRRTGKSSLLNVALSEIKQNHVKIDVREAPYYDRREFMSYVIEKIKESIGESLFQKVLKCISKIKLSYKEISTTFYFEVEKNFIPFFETLNKQLKKKNAFFVIAFDEVQLLNKIKFDYPLAAIYDNYENIKLILTGSEVGLIDEFLGKKETKAPLFGRAVIEIETKKLSNEQISQFLNEGFKQIKKEISNDETRDVIEIFDGIIGWATYYGWLRGNNFEHHKAISKIIGDGSELIKNELDNFLAKRKKAVYLKILKWVASGYNRWSMLKNQFLKNKIRISDRQLDLYLKELIDYSFIEKINKDYLISDPLLIKALKIM